uniref:NADH:ubiquinone reductase (H(+)-translocating) n=1 Tax=Melanips sp. ZJUH 20220003 TaxID=2943452 RepID=A0A9E8K2I3_9HYME|nr:NADH dehydrogenase subunit 5 [Melanips sp. ZJUH 20220003]
MINNLLLINLFISSIINFIMSIIFILSKKIILIDWLIYSINSCNIKFIIYLDWMMFMFLSVVMFISSMVMLYSKEYMYTEMKKKYFIMILFLFIISMILMIISPNIISIILGWDGLGLISYCLIIYYQNFYSFNSGMLTLLTNRIGDVMLIIMIFMMMNIGSWNLIFYNFYNKIFIFMLTIMIMTKSAQMPFSMWLPAAMAAPTPVSSLVHSSTLVTAGIYLLIRFNKLFNTNYMNFSIMMIGLMTMFTASINAIMEFDFKKIIAFSTLSQLGLMMMMLSMQLTNYVFFHLISHAMFKSLLFLCSGIMIHFMNNNQDIRFMGNLINETPLIIMIFNFSNLSLCGFPFMSGFFSKDLLYEMIINFNMNMLIYNLMYLCIMLTIMYSIRLMYYLSINNNMFKSLNMKMDNYIMSISLILLFFMTIMFGNLINWLMFSSMNFSITNINIKNNLYMMMFMGIMILIIINSIKIITKIKFFKLIMKMSLFFLLKNLSMSFNTNFILLNKFIMKINEHNWNEFYNKMFPIFILFNLNKNFNMLFLNKYIYMFLIIMYLFMLMFMYNLI